MVSCFKNLYLIICENLSYNWHIFQTLSKDTAYHNTVYYCQYMSKQQENVNQTGGKYVCVEKHVHKQNILKRGFSIHLHHSYTATTSTVALL